jgi:O-antigen/teichoic acid export membrane protein
VTRSEPRSTSPGSAEVLRGGALSLVGGVVQAGGGFLLTLVVARGLGVIRAGVFFVSIGLLTIVSNTLELGADTGLVRAVPRLRTLGRARDLQRTVICAAVPVFLAGVAASVLVAWFAHPLARTFMQQGDSVLGAGFLRSAAPYLAFAPLSAVVLAGTRGFGTVIPFVTVQNGLMPLIRPAVIGILVWAGVASDSSVAHAWGAPLAVGTVVGGSILVVQLRRVKGAESPSSAAARPFGTVAAEFWSFAGARAFAGIAETMLVWVDVLLVGWLVGPVQAGVYAAASRFITTGTLGLQASRIAIAPRLARALTAGDNRGAAALYNGGTHAVVAMSWPLYLGLACFSPVILRIFGRGFGHGATALTILSIAMLVDTATGNVGSVLLMGGKSRWNIINAFVALAVDLVIDVILIPGQGSTSGATGASIGWAAAIVVVNGLQCVEVRCLMRLRIVDRGTVRTALVTLVCFGVPGLVLGLIGPRGVWALGMWLVVGLVAYLEYWRRRRGGAEITALRQALGMATEPSAAR